MQNELFATEAKLVASRLPAGPRLAIIGSTSFWHPESEATCGILGGVLADFDRLLLLTGGVEGVGATVGRSFHAAVTGKLDRQRVFHLLPRCYQPVDYGETLFAGDDLAERREVLGRLADLYVIIEGGPGTVHEASVALTRSALLIPVGRSGGHAADLHKLIARPSFASERIWRILASAEASPAQVADAVAETVRSHLAEK